jgi:ESS family glutamate:Na+ symporter
MVSSMEIGALATFNLAILVLFLGKTLNQRVPLLRRYNIPEPVSAGLLVCLVTWLMYAV